MRKIEEIAEQILKLSPEEFAELFEWFQELDSKVWDAQIEADLKAGKLDHLISQAEADLDAGRARVLGVITLPEGPGASGDRGG